MNAAQIRRAIFVGGLISAMFCCAAARAQSTDVEAPQPWPENGRAFVDNWYVGVHGGIVVTDQNYNNDGTLYGVRVGRTYGPRYAFELELDTDELDFGIDFGLKHQSIGINHLTINREPLWDPYFLVGLGYIRYDAPAGSIEESGGDFMFNLGVGGQWELVVPEKVMLRADLRLRYDLNDTDQPGQNGFGDGVFTLGLIVPFGGGD
jgi:hypothetical protein